MDISLVAKMKKYDEFILNCPLCQGHFELV